VCVCVCVCVCECVCTCMYAYADVCVPYLTDVIPGNKVFCPLGGFQYCLMFNMYLF